MRKLIFISILCLLAHQSIAQDKIVKLNGETINCKITEIGISTIKFKAEGEDFIRNVVSGKVQEIIFKSGKVEKLNNRIVVLGENDWEKVQIVNSDFDVTGLIKGEEIKATINGSSSATTESKIKNKAFQKLKKIAASKGYHTVVILNTTRKGAHSGKSRGGIKASVTAVGYTY